MVKQKHVALETAKTRLVNRLIRIMGAYRLGNLSLASALQESDKAFQRTMQDITRYIHNVQAKRDLGKAFNPLTEADLSQLQLEIKRKQEDYRRVLQDAKST